MTAIAVRTRPPVVRTARLRVGWLAAGVGALAVAALAALVIGPVSIAPLDALRELVGVDAGLSEPQLNILRELRLPRIVLGMLVGATLSVSGASYQGVFRNPLADPYLLGAAAGAGLGVTLVIVTTAGGGATPLSAPVAAFVGSLLAVALTYALGAAGSGRASTSSLILAGVEVAAPAEAPA